MIYNDFIVKSAGFKIPCNKIFVLNSFLAEKFF